MKKDFNIADNLGAVIEYLNQVMTYPRKCSVTGKGVHQGFVVNGEEVYSKEDEAYEAFRERVLTEYASIEDSYLGGYHYYTEFSIESEVAGGTRIFYTKEGDEINLDLLEEPVQFYKVHTYKGREYVPISQEMYKQKGGDWIPIIKYLGLQKENDGTYHKPFIEFALEYKRHPEE